MYNISAKNTLQEICQKKNLRLPIYETVFTANDVNNPIFTSTVTLYDGSKHRGEPLRTKKDAEQSAASTALGIIRNKYETTYICGVINQQVVETKYEGAAVREELAKRVEKESKAAIAFFIDVENLPKMVDVVLSSHVAKNIPHGHVDVYAFVGMMHPLAKRDFGAQVNSQARSSFQVKKIISPSSRKDGVDTCMQVYIGTLLATDAYTEYIIVTQDHFGGALVDIINNYSKLFSNGALKVSPTAKHICSMDQL